MRALLIYAFAFFAIYLLIMDCTTTPFPNGYEWTEALINYEGGFIRRGLLGQFLYICAGALNAQTLGLAVHVSAWLLFFKLAATRIIAGMDKISSAVILAWPVYFLFFIRTPPAFLRKDQFINLFSLLAVIALVHAWKKGSRSLYFPMLAFFLCFGMAFLIHEAAIFYFALPAWLLGLLWARCRKTALWFALMACLFLSACLVAIRWQGTAEQGSLIEAAWRSRIPEFKGGLAISYLGKSMAGNLADEAQWRSDPVLLTSAGAAFFIALLPVGWLCAGYPVFRKLRLATPLAMRALLPFAALLPWLLPLVAVDFGRHIAMGALQYIIWLWAVISIFRLRPAGWLESANRRLAANKALAAILSLALLVFSITFVLLHWAVPGQALITLWHPANC